MIDTRPDNPHVAVDAKDADGEGVFIELVRGDLWITAYNEGGHNSTSVNFDELMRWVSENKDEIEVLRGWTPAKPYCERCGLSITKPDEVCPSSQRERCVPSSQPDPALQRRSAAYGEYNRHVLACPVCSIPLRPHCSVGSRLLMDAETL